MKATPSDRVRIWNTFFGLAWNQAREVYECEHACEIDDSFRPLGGTLDRDTTLAIGTLLMCALAIEARTNHLIEELVDNGIISRSAGDAAQWLRSEEKWFLLPRLAGKRGDLDADRQPHQAIREICAFRNDLIHVKYKSLATKLPPSPAKVLSLYENFVVAMEDMNVVLGRKRRARKRVLALGKFRCE